MMESSYYVSPLATCRSAVGRTRAPLLALLVTVSFPVPLVAQCLYERRIVPSDSAPLSLFGAPLAMDGQILAVGAPGDDQVTGQGGGVYIFQRDLGGPDLWGERKRLASSQPGSNAQLGISLDLSFDTLVAGTFAAHAAFVFERNEGGPDEWGEVAVLRPDDFGPEELFGRSVGVSGDTAVVGAMGYGSAPSLTGSGAAYVFERNEGGLDEWGEVARLVPSDPVMNGGFGSSVAIDRNTIAVSAIWAEAVYVFERPVAGSSDWVETAKLTASAATSERFGTGLDVSGETIVAGDSYDFLNGPASGAAYVFDKLPSGAWGETTILRQSDPETIDYFGGNLSLVGDSVLISAAKLFTQRTPGRTYLFERDAGGADQWGEIARFVAPDGDVGEGFGGGLAMSGGYAAIGAPRDDALGLQTGEVYVLNPCPGTSYCIASPNSVSPTGAEISAPGSSSLTQASFALRAAPVPAAQTGLFFYGASEMQLPFGNGFLCVDGQLYRLDVETALDGELVHAVDFADPPVAAAEITAGSTWNFQAWYRDPAAGAALFNLSDALRVTFLP